MTVSHNTSEFLDTFCKRAFVEGTLQVLQITDTHLYPNKDGTLLGINTFDSFSDIINLIQTADWPLDFILATGDLMHDASPQGYQELSLLLNDFGIPVYCLPGNHDVPEMMAQYLPAGKVATPNWVDHGSWRVVLLDSVISDGEGGHLKNEQLDRLNQALCNPPANVLVSLHHQPVPVGSLWLDTMLLDNAESFWKCIDTHNNAVKCVLWGHVHQDFEATRGDIKLIASPSTCLQFTPGKDDFDADKQAPGVRLMALKPDGSIETAVIRLDSLPDGLDVDSSGY